MTVQANVKIAETGIEIEKSGFTEKKNGMMMIEMLSTAETKVKLGNGLAIVKKDAKIIVRESFPLPPVTIHPESGIDPMVEEPRPRPRESSRSQTRQETRISLEEKVVNDRRKKSQA